MSTDRIRVAFLVNSLRFGGAEKHTLQLFNELDSQKFQVALAYLKREEHLLGRVNPVVTDQTWCAEFGKGLDWRGLRRLSAWLSDISPDVVVCVNTYPLFYGHLARFLTRQKMPIVEIFHSTELASGDDRKMRWAYQPFFNQCDRIVYVCEAQRRYWESRGLLEKKGACIHNGIDTNYFSDCYSDGEKVDIRERYGFSPNDFVIGICAALRPEKMHGDLLAAVSQLRQQGIPAKCLIIGDGPCRTEIEQLITTLNLRASVAITGFQDDVRPLIAASNCMAIVSSRVETFSIAVLESMAMGKSVVISDIGGAREQVDHGQTGQVFPPGDIQCLVDCIKSIADVSACQRMGSLARQRAVDQFGANRMIKMYEDLFATVASQNKAR